MSHKTLNLHHDTTNHIHIHDPINDAVEDAMNVNLKKKVTFADIGSLDLPLSFSPTESATTTDYLTRDDLSPNDDPLTPEEPSSSLITSDLSQTATRKSILQKPVIANGCVGQEKVYHGLGIRPHDELIFERTDSPPHGTADCIHTIILTNMGDKILTFKIKTTSPDKFRVKPGCSLLHPGASTTISVYLLKAFCVPNSNISKEKFLIIWTLIGQELKQTQLVDFWKTVPSSVLYEHRLKCSFGNKLTSGKAINQSNELNPLHLSTSSDPAISEMQKILKDSVVLQQTTLTQTSNELKQIRYLLLIIFALLMVILLWDVCKYFFSMSSSVKSDL